MFCTIRIICFVTFFHLVPSFFDIENFFQTVNMNLESLLILQNMNSNISPYLDGFNYKIKIMIKKYIYIWLKSEMLQVKSSQKSFASQITVLCRLYWCESVHLFGEIILD